MNLSNTVPTLYKYYFTTSPRTLVMRGNTKRVTELCERRGGNRGATHPFLTYGLMCTIWRHSGQNQFQRTTSLHPSLYMPHPPSSTLLTIQLLLAPTNWPVLSVNLPHVNKTNKIMISHTMHVITCVSTIPKTLVGNTKPMDTQIYGCMGV